MNLQNRINNNGLLPFVIAGSLAALSSNTLSACGGERPLNTPMENPPSCPYLPLSIDVARGSDGRCNETNPPYNAEPTVQVLGISSPGTVRLFSARVSYEDPCPTSLSQYNEIASQSVDGNLPYVFFPLKALGSDTCLRSVMTLTNTCTPLESMTYRFSCGF